MPRRPRPVQYREALEALQEIHRSIHAVLAIPRLPREAKERLHLLAARLVALLMRDDGRSQ